jgi:polyisoprenoid-binding protein YceI
MKTLTLTAALAAAALLTGGPALAQTAAPKANCQPSASPRGDAAGRKAKAPDKIEGQVTNVNPSAGTITVRNKDGSTHEFKGTTDTLQEYKAGDNIELTLRAEPC